MAKSETPAGAYASLRQPRPAVGRPELNRPAPGGRPSFGDSPEAQGFPQAPGLAKARARRSELANELADTTRSSIFPELFDAELLGDDDVLDAGASQDAALPYDGISDDLLQDLIGDLGADAVSGGAVSGGAVSGGVVSGGAVSRDEGLQDDGVDGEARADDVFSAARFGVPRVGRAKVPMANLEPPSSSRVELTPSPVPRVSLAPATGAVDISLVPGPNARLSRNLPTLAAQHALGRRQQRRAAAPAMTVPPTEATAREPRVSADLPKDVRSSKGEVVLGLMIGLGLSLVLAAVGQAYLREDVIAESSAPTEERAPDIRPREDIESVMLSARPESGGGAATGGAERLEGARAAGGVASAAPALAARQRLVNADSQAESKRRAAPSGTEPVIVAAARLEPAKRASDKGQRERAEARQRAKARRVPAAAAETSDFEVDKPLAEPSPEPAHLTPAESAGLGLDLPL
jgi:hypothetical protein